MKRFCDPLQQGGGGAAESGVRPASPGAPENSDRPASPYAAGTGAAACPSVDPEEEKRTIRDGMDIAEVRRILQEYAGQTVIYLHDGGRFELTGAVLCEAPQAGMAHLPFGEYVLCAEKARGIL